MTLSLPFDRLRANGLFTLRSFVVSDSEIGISSDSAAAESLSNHELLRLRS